MHWKPAPLLLLLVLACCDGGSDATRAKAAPHRFEVSGLLQSRHLDEASGIQAGGDGVFFVHNDEGKPLLHVTDLQGRDLGAIEIKGAKNKDWEDVARVRREQGAILVIGDIGDNNAKRKSVRLYFVEEPRPGEDGRYPSEADLLHVLKLRYPKGPRDAEALAFDPQNDMILVLSKRDDPPRLYGVSLRDALATDETAWEYLGEGPALRPPTVADLLAYKKRGAWVSQPTGMDISEDGSMAAVITYRSLYVFRRADGEAWVEAFRRNPVEFVGPPGTHEEAVTFSHDAQSIVITTERRPAPIYRIALPDWPEL